MGEKAEEPLRQLADYLGVSFCDNTPGHGHRVLTVRSNGTKIPISWKTTLLEFPRGSDLERHYLRGLIDGDGGVYDYGRGKQIHFLYADSQPEVGAYFRDVLDRLKVKYGDYTKAPARCRYVQVWSPNSELLARFLYEDSAIAMPHKKHAALS